MTDTAVDARCRRAQFAELEARTFDIAVIGGGITGAGIARDAAMRGLSVALVEARDFASGTSSRSSKMIHGGLRYLAQGDVALVKEAASERQVLRRIAPHLTRLSQFLLPTTNMAMAAKLRAGLWTFEKLGNVPESEKHRQIGLAELRRSEPLLRTDGFNGAILYPEFLTDDARLVLANIRSARAAGAVVLNHAAATALDPEGLVAVSTLEGEALGAIDTSAPVKYGNKGTRELLYWTTPAHLVPAWVYICLHGDDITAETLAACMIAFDPAAKIRYSYTKKSGKTSKRVGTTIQNAFSDTSNAKTATLARICGFNAFANSFFAQDADITPQAIEEDAQTAQAVEDTAAVLAAALK